MLRPALVILSLALLAACNKSNGAERSATGRVLEGTVSDAMLPVDTVTSEPPLAEPTEAPDKAAKGHAGSKGATADSAGDKADQPDAAATPAAETAAAASTDD